jgi:sporulation protein YlmC with PRC-barrel domain
VQKVNELFGKRVIEQQTGEGIGVVRDVVLDAETRQIVAIVFGSSRSNEQVVRRAQVSGMGEFVVVDGAEPFLMANDDAEIIELRRSAERITGKKIISASGEQIGVVGDLYFHRSGAIAGFELKHGLFGGSDPQVVSIDDVQAIGKDAVITRTSQPTTLSALAASDDAADPNPGQLSDRGAQPAEESLGRPRLVEPPM